MCVVQIGELVARLSEEVKAKDVTIPWRIIKDTRNFYVHAYGAIDVPSVWNTLSNDIPALKTACENILKDCAIIVFLSYPTTIEGAMYSFARGI